jgi:hypothetical protein
MTVQFIEKQLSVKTFVGYPSNHWQTIARNCMVETGCGSFAYWQNDPHKNQDCQLYYVPTGELILGRCIPKQLGVRIIEKLVAGAGLFPANLENQRYLAEILLFELAGRASWNWDYARFRHDKSPFLWVSPSLKLVIKQADTGNGFNLYIRNCHWSNGWEIELAAGFPSVEAAKQNALELAKAYVQYNRGEDWKQQDLWVATILPAA